MKQGANSHSGRATTRCDIFRLADTSTKIFAVWSILNIQGKFMNGFRKMAFVSYNGALQINIELLPGFLQSRPMSVFPKA